MRILGWNLQPGTNYQVVVLKPDGQTIPSLPIVTTDGEGDFLGDDYHLTPEERAVLTSGQPHVVSTDTSENGTYEVRVYVEPWSGSLEDVPVASTTFFQN